MDINQELQYMYSLERFGVKLGLEVMEQVLRVIGNPEKDLKIIHIAGTNGKGSTAAMIESIIRTSGYKTGLYTSPHLIRFNERIRVDGKQIEDEEIAFIVKDIKEACKENNLQPTFFEFTTALALKYFADKKPDYVVLETGMGGKLDATNIVKPLLSIITNVTIDHTNYLGTTTMEIALKKSKVIKENTPFITAEASDKIIDLFKEECAVNKAAYYNINDEYEVKILESDLNHQIFRINDDKYELSIIGEHQVINACIAIKASELLGIDKEHVKKGLKLAKWNGRLEIVSKEPLVILEGAHNVAGMEQLKQFLDRHLPRVSLVIGMSEDKEHEEMIKKIEPFAEKIILTKAKFKGTNPSNLKKYFSKKVDIVLDVKEAVKKAMKESHDLPVLVTGSLYMIGEAKEFFEEISLLQPLNS